MKRIIKRLLLTFKNKNCKIMSKNVSFDVKLESNVKIYNNVYIANKVSIGRFTYISFDTKIYENTKIGAFCSIGPNCVIGPGNHDYKLFTTHPILYDKTWNKDITNHININNKDTVIENDVWIGCNSIILNGVRIGTGAIIGAGTIITKDVPPYAIVVGNPGKIIKYRFDKNRIQEILDSKWWEKDISDITKMK
ncbi:hypothetical protein IV49_GL002083 [Kandleria vitulina DSM 20405]|uniref:Acetyltransferase n=1 Tax=Kandleria vitulina DSM 20405 TaxID=1410657 RepID=A0A0R2HBK9_9FIRM|nr:CatB-related O-acetyltransferase [Kandleria vitulina]KRN50435.1 hypothetical protein IV49_GL002083 [Kandleria vitulina DSM 20405]